MHDDRIQNNDWHRYSEGNKGIFWNVWYLDNWITQVYAFIKMYQILQLRLMHSTFVKHTSIKNQKKKKWKAWSKHFHENGNKYDILPRQWRRSSIQKKLLVVLSKIKKYRNGRFCLQNLWEPSRRFMLWSLVKIIPRDVVWTVKIVLKQCYQVSMCSCKDMCRV